MRRWVIEGRLTSSFDHHVHVALHTTNGKASRATYVLSHLGGAAPSSLSWDFRLRPFMSSLFESISGYVLVI